MPMAHVKTVHNSALSLDQLLLNAESRKPAELPYAGEVTPEEAYQFLQEHDAILVDVRTPQEWQSVGIADVDRCALISWKTLPDFEVNPRFAEEVAAIEGAQKDTPIFFLCKSGGRSLDAAVAMGMQSYRYCFNISGGFEGNLSCNQPGWKQLNLPCKQG